MIEVWADEAKKRLGLIINGFRYDESEIHVLPVGIGLLRSEVGLFITPETDSAREALLTSRLLEFPTEPWTLSLQGLQYSLINTDYPISQTATLYRNQSGDHYVHFDVRCDASNWTGRWSASQYREQFEAVARNDN